MFELLRCKESFDYFLENHIKTNNPHESGKPFRLKNIQRKYLEFIDSNQFLIVSKPRQTGFTTATLLKKLWECLVSGNRHILWITSHKCECEYVIDQMESYISNMKLLENDFRYVRNDCGTPYRFQFLKNKNVFEIDTAHNCDKFRGKRFTDLVIDEAAYIKNMDKVFKSLFPCLTQTSRFVIISSDEGVEGEEFNWFKDTFKKSEENKSLFKSITFKSNDRIWFWV